MQKFIFLTTIIILFFCNCVFAEMNDYCQAPPFISAAAAPNVLLMVDTSGSMGWKAYSYGGVAYDSKKIYEGYFDPEKYYFENIEGVYEEAPGACPAVCPSSPGDDRECKSDNPSGYGCKDLKFDSCSGKNKWNCCKVLLVAPDTCSEPYSTGNYFNYKYMARVDLLRWAMTGGTPDGCNNSIDSCDPEVYSPTNHPAQLTCDDNGCVIETDGGIKVKARWDRITGEEGGLLHKLKKLPLQPRMGSMYFGGDQVNHTVLMGDFTGSASFDGVNPYKNTIVALNNQSPTGSTPTGPALWAARAYLAQNTSVYGSPGPQTGEAAEWKNPMYQCFDRNNDGNCQGNEMVQVPCAKNFVILLTDGQWNTGGNPGSVTTTCNIDSGYEDSSADPVVPAYWLHKKGFVNAPTNVTTNVESLYALGLWLGGSGVKALKQVAMYGGFNTAKNWPGTMTDYPKVSGCYPDDCAGLRGKGSPCTELPTPSSDWDSNGDNLPDTFFMAGDASEIKNQIMTIIYDIMRKASSGTAVSVLSSSEGSGANLMQALFYPKRSFSNNTEVSWTSDLMNYWYYFDPFFSSMQIREDTIREGADSYTLLDLKLDYITTFAYDLTQNKTLAHRWEDTAGTGSIATSADKGTVPIEDTIAIWRAGFNLWWTSPTNRNIYTTLDGSSLLPFATDKRAELDDFLGQTTSAAEANATINYVLGYDCADATGAACACGSTGCSAIGRSRTVTTGVCSARKSPCDSSTDCPAGETCNTETHVWKMGDIISSTPRIMGPGNLNTFNSPSPYGYNDKSYSEFIMSNDYKDRQLVFVGANDGMLHAFKLGKLLQKWSGKQWYQAAKQEGTTAAGGVGSESYAFIPKNVLPYLQYLHDEDYCHIYMTDGPTTLTDASINIPSNCLQDDYWNCPKITTTIPATSPATGYAVDFSKTSWRTTLIGSMGIGGATCEATSYTANRILPPLTDNSVGLSSYFALDVTEQKNPPSPELLWEFSHPDLGVTNVGAGVIKVGGNDKRCSNNDAKTCSIASECGTGDPAPQCVSTNGRWFSLMASGSTGPIANQEFKGTSDKTLKLFVVDLKSGELVRTIDTGIANAFAGSISTGAIDLDKTNASDSGNYQDDAVYIGYVQQDETTTANPKPFTKGGVIRLVINDDPTPTNWTFSKVFKDYEIGPVTTSVANLLDRKTGKLWLYFAEGRYFYKTDDPDTQRKLFGIQEPCFNATTNTISNTCTPLELNGLKNQTSSPTSTLDDTVKGWFISMNAAASPNSAERVISNPTTDPLGAIYFLSFAPTDDICSFGGTTYLWALDYKTGGRVTYLIQGKALIQVSTGEIKELKLSDAFTENDNRKSLGFKGIPPTGQGIMIITNPSPIKKFMHVQEQ